MQIAFPDIAILILVLIVFLALFAFAFFKLCMKRVHLGDEDPDTEINMELYDMIENTNRPITPLNQSLE